MPASVWILRKSQRGLTRKVSSRVTFIGSLDPVHGWGRDRPLRGRVCARRARAERRERGLRPGSAIDLHPPPPGESNDGFRFHLHQVLVSDQVRLHQGVRGQDARKALAMGAGHGLPVGHVPHEDPGAHHVLEPPAERLQRALDLVDDEVQLGRRRRGRRRPGRRWVAVVPGDRDAVAAATRPAEPGEGLPRRCRSRPGCGRPGPPSRAIRRRERLEMVAQVARGGEERRPPVLVAAVAGKGPQSLHGGLRAPSGHRRRARSRRAAGCPRCARSLPAGRPR